MRVLVVSPHADDEVLGCGGMVLRRTQAGDEVDIVVGSISTVRAGDKIKSTASNRNSELAEAARRLGANPPTVLFDNVENQLDTLPMLDIISALDRTLSEKEYDQVFLPYPSHHQDHRVLYEAGYSALREKGGGHYPSMIALYEYPYVGWTPTEFHGGRYYVDITDQLEAKLHALSAYESQIFPAPHPTSLESTRTLAAMRGMECGRRYAELFYVTKMVD